MGRVGASLPTRAHLEFQLAHAQARDAVHRPFDGSGLCRDLAADVAPMGLDCLLLDSAAGTRAVYLQRPDLGRRLDEASRRCLADLAPPAQSPAPRLAWVIADGLSALAIERQARPFLAQVMPGLAAAGWGFAPLCVVRQGRVAIGDEIGERLGADLVVVLIGERPGLSSPDSMGLYLTWAPRVGLTDERRNCISNIRPAGLSTEEASLQLQWLVARARQLRLSGVALKDERGSPALSAADTPR